MSADESPVTAGNRYDIAMSIFIGCWTNVDRSMEAVLAEFGDAQQDVEEDVDFQFKSILHAEM